MALIADFRLPSEWREQLASPLVQWGGLLCAVLIVWSLTLAPYQVWRAEQQAQFDQQQLQWQRQSALANARQKITDAAAYAEQANQQARLALLTSRTHSRAISEQVSAVERLFRPIGLRFTGRRFGEPDTAPWLGEIVDSQWRLTGTSDQVLDFIYALAHAPQLLQPMQLEVRPARTGRNEQPQYEISVDLRSYRAMSLTDLKAYSQAGGR
ncbi:hypothetical protein M3906_002731 [Vibrio metschnikovii]|nr:hypothetical protein [Vibrio metschnikovii]EKO3677100.1 hypothetical protein [Vibrio metschnikovii]